MKHMFRFGVIVTAALALAGAPTAWAACTVTSQPVFHGYGGWIDQCPGNLVSGYIYLLSSPATVNVGTGADTFVCEEGGVLNGISLTCQAEAGLPYPADSNVTVQYDFITPTAVGCPNPTEAGPNGVTPVGVQVLCSNGASVLVNVGYVYDSLQFIMEYAGPADFSPMHASFQNGPTLTSFSAGPSPSANNVCVNVPTPTAYSDCDPGSFANALPAENQTCSQGPGSRAQIARGNVYTREALCGSSPDARIASGWVALPNPQDAAGNVCNTINRPTVAGMCTFIGASGKVGATETPALLSWFQVAGPGAANDKVKIDHAAFDKGKLIVGFSTTNETSIVSFNVYSDATKLNGNPITANGAGSNAYTFEVGRGALKGGKTVLVEAVKSDGTVEKSAPVTLK
jgi:hypothetical protein